LSEWAVESMGAVEAEMSEGTLARNGGTLFSSIGGERREIRIGRIVLGSRFLLRESITEVTFTFTRRFNNVPHRDLPHLL
jgi:hypothetical protein